ncbi:MAG: hypothetical protein Kow0042_07800 [Calditrichia bacterium]
MRETGIVLKNTGNLLEVQMQPSASCEGCSACFINSEKMQILTIPEESEAQPGDQVEIEIKPGFALKSAFLLFFLPLLMLIVGYYVFRALGIIPGLSSAYQGILGAICGLVITYIGVHIYDKYLQKSAACSHIRILRVIHHEGVFVGKNN